MMPLGGPRSWPRYPNLDLMGKCMGSGRRDSSKAGPRTKPWKEERKLGFKEQEQEQEQDQKQEQEQEKKYEQEQVIIWR